MPLFLIERRFAEQLEIEQEGLDAINAVNDEVGVDWLFSFLSADKKKTYCLYQAACADDIYEAAKRLNLPADAVVEVSRIGPHGASDAAPT